MRRSRARTGGDRQAKVRMGRDGERKREGKRERETEIESEDYGGRWWRTVSHIDYHTPS